MKIGSFETDGYAALAPMAGVADRSFRRLCREFGAAYTVSELISSKAVSLNDKKSLGMMNMTENERPVGLQLFGSDPQTMAEAAVKGMQFCPDFIDINMGCPAPKVAGNGGGAALMKDPKLAESIVKSVVDAVKIPVTVKIRSGWDENSINAVEIAKRSENAGAEIITVHGRTRQQMYAPSVNLDIIKKVKNAVSIPVVGNGDIETAKDAANMYEYTGCDFVMVGRGAMGAPWIFRQINAWMYEGITVPEPPLSERMRVLIRQAQMTVEDKGEHNAMREMRKHAAWYMKGIKGAAAYRRECGQLSSLEQLYELCFKVCKENE